MAFQTSIQDSLLSHFTRLSPGFIVNTLSKSNFLLELATYFLPKVSEICFADQVKSLPNMQQDPLYNHTHPAGSLIQSTAPPSVPHSADINCTLSAIS